MEQGGPERRAQFSAGQMVGHYRVDSWLGEGAMGVVYRAFDTHLDRPVAIKVLRPESTANPERRQRFVQEAKAASSLNHPNIVTIYDISTADGIDFIAMEYIDGKTLNPLIGRKGMRWNEALKYSIQIADALAAAHAAGLVHRDLKPANIMVTGQGLVKVLDFGLAKLIEPTDDSESVPEGDPWTPTETVRFDLGPKTEDGAIVGTVAYMSPEQAQGKPLDARSDIFSFGSVLYEMLTGQWAFHGETKLAILAAILQGEPKPLASVVEGVPLELEKLLNRCLRKDPDRRFQNMSDLKVTLQELKEESESGRLAAPVVRGSKGAIGRRSLLLVAVAVAIALAVVALLFSLWPPAEKQLALLPFTNVGGDSANQAFCDGLPETLASKLTQLEQFQKSLRVVSPSEVRREKISSARDARQAFGVSLVITGNILRSSRDVQVTVNLVDAKTGIQLRSRTIRTPPQALSDEQDPVINAIVEMLELELGPQARLALSAGGTAVPGAYDFYVQGRGYMQRYDRTENIDNAIAHFGKAVQKDTSYALAYAALGEAYWQKHRLTRDLQWVEPARRSCGRAMEINNRLVPVHVTLGMISRGTGRFQEAIEELDAALKIDPVNADAYREMAGVYEAMGRIDPAEATFQRAIQLRPRYWAGYMDLGGFYYRRGRYPDAEKQYRAAIELTPDNARAHSSLGAIYHLMGRDKDAARMLGKSLAIKATPEAYTNLGTVYYFQRRYAEAVPMMEKAIGLGAADYQSWGNLAEAYGHVPALAAKASEAYGRAILLAEKQLTINPAGAPVRASLASYYAKTGNRERALAQIEEARRLAPENVNILFRSALVYELTGDRDRALSALADAVGGGYSLDEIRRAADLEELQKDPRYQRLLEGRSSR